MGSVIQHDLNLHFPELASFNATSELTTSALYRKLKNAIESVLGAHEWDDFSSTAPQKQHYRAVAWNIERGTHLDGILQAFHQNSELQGADVLLVTEADIGMARSGNRNVARELAQRLNLNYFFVPAYLNLAKGVGHEQELSGDNTLALHGNAILARYPITNKRSVALANGKDKMRGNEKRIGCQRVPIAEIQFPDRTLTTACIHLDAHSRRRHRFRQMQQVLGQLAEFPSQHPILLGGDWNTSTYNSHHSVHAIVGFWIRVMMGVDNMINNHYVHPDRFWERRLFKSLEAAGFNYKDFNLPGVGTLTYDIRDIKQYKNLGDWIPQWCFHFIAWSLKNHNGICPFKLDWFAAKGLTPLKPHIFNKLRVADIPMSDHAAIVTDFKFP